ncbi:nucleotidyltransferase family protein [Saccharothrix variisporea]|uniref:Uncharacterized protein n=1 Tax=Saccharothrix variisporea TaxID=543527 RepID=A0A495X817_9PSEU|nr:nucleotidyltransferase family protein [Saccharothrix variisporea]RKT69305.1 hypothetical protein DFJ66_2513 [Saccharothrix variisporea]
MTTSTRSDHVTLDLALCARLLGVDPDEHPRLLLRAAREQGWSLPVTVLSLLARDGVALGSGSGDELRRARARKAEYAGTVDAMVTATGGRVVKGPSLAELYPDGVDRAVGDIDFIVPDEAALWRAAAVVLDRHPVETINLSLFGQPERGVLVVLEWQADDPVLDNDFKVEICTTPFAGDAAAVPVRSGLPADRRVADLLALGEERFQRPFSAKDLLDIAVVGGVERLAVDDLVDAARRLLLAPELVELFDRADEAGVLGALAPALPGLRSAAEDERTRRAAWEPPPAPAEVDRIGEALASGRVVGGLLLRRTAWRSRLPGVHVHRYAGGALLITPLGDFMAVDDPLVDEDDYHAALAELARFDAKGARP